MARISKDELISKINEKVTDEDVKIELMEDVTDSFDGEDNSLQEEVDRLNEEVASLKEKYKERFLKSDDVEKKEDEIKEDDDDEEKVIDVKEI